jgi:hypothetical protein
VYELIAIRRARRLLAQSSQHVQHGERASTRHVQHVQSSQHVQHGERASTQHVQHVQHVQHSQHVQYVQSSSHNRHYVDGPVR